MLNTQFLKDWEHPRSLRGCTGYSAAGEQNTSGTIMRAVCNTSIPCSKNLLNAEGKAHVSLTVVSIVKTGFAFAPWKRGQKSPDKKDLFGNVQSVRGDSGESLISSVDVFSFPRVGKDGKGDRIDNVVSTVEVGDTYHFVLHRFMYEKQKDDTGNVFPKDIEAIPPFTLVEIVVDPVEVTNCESGYGLKLSRVRTIPYQTLYSHMTPLFLKTVCTTLTETMQRIEAKLNGENAAHHYVRNVSDVKNPSFLAKVGTDCFICCNPEPVDNEKMFTISSEGGEVTPLVHGVNVTHADLCRYTNTSEFRLFILLFSLKSDIISESANEDGMLPCFLVDLAIQADALYLYIHSNEYYLKGHVEGVTQYRGVPLIDTTKVLEFISTEAEPDCDGFLNLAVPYKLGEMGELMLSVSTTREDIEGPPDKPVPSPDFTLASPSFDLANVYRLKFYTEARPCIATLFYRTAEKMAGCKRGFARINYEDV